MKCYEIHKTLFILYRPRAWSSLLTPVQTALLLLLLLNVKI